MKDYELITSIAKSVSSELWKALDKKSDRYVALKIIRRNVAGAMMGESAAQNRELSAIATLSHRNIASVLNMGLMEDGAPYIIMEYIEGESLRDLIRRKTALVYSQWVDIFLAVADALRYAYQRNIIHRDIKPSNIMLTSEGVPKIVDFGLARFLRQDISGRRRHGYIVGTPDYMSPEQALGMNTDHRSDIYSLGATIYHCLAGRPPFEGKTDAELLEKQKSTSPLPLYLLNPRIPEDLSNLVVMMMEKDITARLQDYDTLIESLNAVKLTCLSQERHRTANMTDILTTQTSAGTPPSSTIGDNRDKHPLRNLLILGTGGVLIVLALISLSVTRTERNIGRNKKAILSLIQRHAIITGALTDEYFAQGSATDAVNLRFKTIIDAIRQFEVENRRLPGSLHELVARRYIAERDTLDPWGSHIQFNSDLKTLVSAGPDKKENTPDDLTMKMD